MVENSKLLFDAAAVAGVGESPLLGGQRLFRVEASYFRGKGLVEEMLMRSGLSYAIIRPTLVFGEGDLLLNNMAWALPGISRLRERRLPSATRLR